MAPIAFVNRIDRVSIYTSPKASCRSVEDFVFKLNKSKQIKLRTRASYFVFRNPFRRLISAYINKYVEHERYRELSLNRCQGARLDTFSDFIEELYHSGWRCIDRVHFLPQRSRYRIHSFDRIFDADNMTKFSNVLNALCNTQLEMSFVVAPNRPIGFPRDSFQDHRQRAIDTPWSLNREELLELVEHRALPVYSSFYDSRLISMVKSIYSLDFRFLEYVYSSGRITLQEFQQLGDIGTALGR
jgi:hypothetical protein